ncbi:hypothetical protein [Flavobacterium sp. AG291]|uniref:hypothetical protein n=1 Tax=Flavobacterium sp. AG291 TaxID=2184000 RepID=UPI000E2CAB5C|nr:hypothetical protein [Flavobacterium sp. AG291]RDI12103.1 hypothetical protein DEU42_10435 [Flavobacterium sp. AG291]
MKKINLFVACLAFMGLTACSDDDGKYNVNGNANAVANNLKSGTWRITLFQEDGNDETGNFEGYNFTFGENGVLTATNGTNTYTGAWSVYDDDNSDDDSTDDSFDSDIDIDITFTEPLEFVDLTDDWDIAARTGTEIKLVDVSGGDGGVDYLTFQKN